MFSETENRLFWLKGDVKQFRKWNNSIHASTQLDTIKLLYKNQIRKNIVRASVLFDDLC